MAAWLKTTAFSFSNNLLLNEFKDLFIYIHHVAIFSILPRIKLLTLVGTEVYYGPPHSDSLWNPQL